MRKAIGIDLGGTEICGGVVDERGRILRISRRDTEAEKGREVVLENISKVIEELMKINRVDAIGIGSPGTIDVEKGRVLSIGGNISGWAFTNVREELSKKFDLPIFVENDANVAAICEGWIGAGKGLDSFVMITLGTGVGGGIYSAESGIWHGKHYQGAELGHVILYPGGRNCKCGQRGCVEQYISGNSIERSYYEMTGKQLKAKDIFKGEKEDKYAGEIVEFGTLEHIFNNPSHPYTLGLFGCIPSLHQDVERLKPIPGMMPNPTDLPVGCNFFERCSSRMDCCKEKKPATIEVEPGHLVKCFMAGEELTGR